MKSLLVLLAIVAVAVAVPSALSVGIAHMKGAADAAVDGTVYFVQMNDTHHWVWANISGISSMNSPDALHGMHVHQFGDVTSSTAASAGSHYVGAGSTNHGCPDNTVRHEGDMGNWQATGGKVMMSKTVDLLATTGGNSIIGKAVVLHNLTDDCANTNSSGGRLAYGVIGIANPQYFPLDVNNTLAGLTNFNNIAASGDNSVMRAIAVLLPTTNNAAFTVTGTVIFEQNTTSNDVTIWGMFTGLSGTTKQGFGIHIHTFADYYSGGTAVTAVSASGHWDTAGNPHGGPGNLIRHIGDLGNICSFDSSTAYYKWVMNDGKFSLNGANSILGRNLIVHDSYDNMTAAGASALGARIALGVIGVMNATAIPTFSIPNTLTVRSPWCNDTVPTAGPTAGPTTTPNTPGPTTKSGSSTTGSPAATTSSASFVSFCAAALFFVLFVTLF